MISILFNIKLVELHQRADKFLSIYYKRVIDLISRIEAKDRSPSISSAIFFTLLKLAILDIILRAFIRELNNLSIRQKATREIIFANRLLRNIYSLAEEARRINLEV